MNEQASESANGPSLQLTPTAPEALPSSGKREHRFQPTAELLGFSDACRFAQSPLTNPLSWDSAALAPNEITAEGRWASASPTAAAPGPTRVPRARLCPSAGSRGTRAAPPPLLHFHPPLLEESNCRHLTEFAGLKHVWAEQRENTPSERQARAAVPRKCYFLAAAMRLEQPAGRWAPGNQLLSGGREPALPPRVSPMPPCPDTQPSCPLPCEGRAAKDAAPAVVPRLVNTVWLRIWMQSIVPPSGPRAPDSPSAASPVPGDKPTGWVTPGAAAAARRRSGSLAGPHNQLFLPAPGHPSALTAFPMVGSQLFTLIS